jgi:adenylate cyclase
MAPDPTPEDLERQILGGEPVYDGLEIAERTGTSFDEARRLWRALGFPEFDAGQVAFTEGDARALAIFQKAVEDGLLDYDTAVNMTRAVGQTMARLADWEVATLVPKLERLGMGSDETGSRLAGGMRLVEEIGPPFEELLVYAWRRHLAAAVARVEALAARAEDVNTSDLTVGFADLVSFTALSNEIGEVRVGDLVEVFESRCHDVVSAHRGRVIKSLGDSVLFVADDAVRALDMAEGIIQVIGRDSRMPDVRIGLASGSVVLRLGDVFGPPVNLAARLTTVARRNRVIIDEATARLLPEEGFEVRHLPARPVRGFGLVEPIAVRRT